MIRTAQELKAQAVKEGIYFWQIHQCSMCKYPCGYRFTADYEHVRYDSGCYCLAAPWQERTWQDVADQYNRNQPENNPEIKRQYLKAEDEFWGFNQNENTTKGGGSEEGGDTVPKAEASVLGEKAIQE